MTESLGLDSAEALMMDGGTTSITISSDARTKLEYIRAEMDGVSQAATFDELLLGLIEVAEDHPEMDFRVPEHVKSRNVGDTE